MGIRSGKLKPNFFAVFLFLFIFIVSAGAAQENEIEIISRFWEYEPTEIKKVVDSRFNVVYESFDLGEFSEKEEKAYHLMRAAACKSSEVSFYNGLYRYKCMNKSMAEIFQAAIKEPMIFLFINSEDAETVSGFLGRYIDFLDDELKISDGMPVSVSYMEFLLSIKNYLDVAYPNNGKKKPNNVK